MGLYVQRDAGSTFSGDLSLSSRGDLELASSVDSQKNVTNFWLRTDFGEYAAENSVGCNLGAFVGARLTEDVLSNMEAVVVSSLRTTIFAQPDVEVAVVPFDTEEALVVVNFAGTYLDNSGNFVDIQPQRVLYTFPYIESNPTPLINASGIVQKGV